MVSEQLYSDYQTEAHSSSATDAELVNSQVRMALSVSVTYPAPEPL